MKLTKLKLKEIIRKELMNEGDEIYVQGVGKYSYDTLKKNVERKLQDLLKRSKKDNHASIGKSQLDVLTRMWLALKDYENEKYSS